jgi:hypothetical protein
VNRLFGITLIVSLMTPVVLRAQTFPGLTYERPSLFWSASKRPDGSTRFWDPAVVQKVNSNLVCVIYYALDEKGHDLGLGNPTPRILAKTLLNAKPELEESHRHGIKVIGYQDTIQFRPSTFKSEGIDPETLYARDIDGKKVPCDQFVVGNFVSCINNPKWIDLQKQVTLVTAEAGLDALQFDLHPYAVAPRYHCHCEHCQREWESYTKDKFGAARPMPGTKLDKNDPLHRTFLEWRMQCMARFLKTVEAYVHRSHPDFVVFQNNCVDGSDYPYLALNDAIDFPSTELWHLALGDESSLYMYRLTEALNGGKALGLINSSPQVDPIYRYRAAIAESYAGGSAMLVGGGPSDVPRQYLKFVEEHEKWLADSHSDASVGILFSWRDQVFVQSNDISAPFLVAWKQNSFRRAAALLARRGVPYDFVAIEKGLVADQLARYKVLVAPEITLLDDSDAAALKQYVSSGGHLLCIGNLGASKSVRDDYIKRPKQLLTDWTGNEPDSSYWQESVDAGSIAFVPSAITGDSEQKMTPTADFNRAAQDLGLESQLKLKCSATVEATIREKQPERFIHLVRLGPTDESPGVSASIDFSLPHDAHISSVEAASPNSSTDLSVTWAQTSPDILHIDLKNLEQYAIIHFGL